MARMRRDKLKRLAKNGRLVMTSSYHFDDLHGASRGNVEMPVAYSEERGIFPDGVCVMRPHDFASGVGGASVSDDGKHVTLYIHSNHNVSFRVLDDDEADAMRDFLACDRNVRESVMERAAKDRLSFLVVYRGMAPVVV